MSDPTGRANNLWIKDVKVFKFVLNRRVGSVSNLCWKASAFIIILILSDGFAVKSLFENIFLGTWIPNFLDTLGFSKRAALFSSFVIFSSSSGWYAGFSVLLILSCDNLLTALKSPTSAAESIAIYSMWAHASFEWSPLAWFSYWVIQQPVTSGAKSVPTSYSAKVYMTSPKTSKGFSKPFLLASLNAESLAL